MATPAFSSTSPFTEYASRNEKTLVSFFENNNVAMPPEGARHFISHCNEFSPEALASLLDQYQEAGCPEGVHEYNLSGEVVTRLWGPEYGNPSVLNEERFLAIRGQGRPPEEVILREKPFQPDDRGVIIQFGGVVWTVHSGPSMPKMEHDPEGLWDSNAIAYSQDELQVVGVPCYKWTDMGECGSEQINIATRYDMLKAAEGSEDKVTDVLAENFASIISYKEYCQIRFSSLE